MAGPAADADFDFEAAFCRVKHREFILGLETKAKKNTFEYMATEHLRMSGVYWGVAAMALLVDDTADAGTADRDDASSSKTTTTSTLAPLAQSLVRRGMDRDKILAWMASCYHADVGGYGGNVDHDAHMLYTLSAVQIALMLDALDTVDVDAVCKYVASLQQPDGSFFGDQWGEIDTRFVYCAVSSKMSCNCLLFFFVCFLLLTRTLPHACMHTQHTYSHAVLLPLTRF
jgi:geranylgeranyl transferase type-2 subunit beta